MNDVKFKNYINKIVDDDFSKLYGKISAMINYNIDKRCLKSLSTEQLKKHKANIEKELEERKYDAKI